VALYTVVFNLINLLFTVISKAYPQIQSYNYYSPSSSISFPVATLIIFFPIFILLMWLLEKGYVTEPLKKQIAIRRWLTYITLFIAGLSLAGDLVSVLYYFIDGQELTTGFLLKALVVLVLAGLVFFYYISDIREKLNSKSRKMWALVSGLIILASIIWGFSVLGSPRTQQLIKYDEQRVNDLQNVQWQILNYYQRTGSVPQNLEQLADPLSGFMLPKDRQTSENYEYKKTGNLDFELCANFNLSRTGGTMPYEPLVSKVGADENWNHPGAHHCFKRTIDPTLYPVAKRVI